MAHEWAEGRDWSEFEMSLYEDMAHDTDALNDGMLQSMFNLGYFDMEAGHDERQAAREWIDDYLMEEYGWDFDDYFDWDAWRDAYSES